MPVRLEPAKADGDEATALAGYRESNCHFLGRLLPFFQYRLPAHTIPSRGLEHSRRWHGYRYPDGVVKNFQHRFSRGRCVHYSQRLGADGIHCATSGIVLVEMGKLVWRAFSPALSDVLGRAPGLSYLAIRHPTRAGR